MVCATFGAHPTPLLQCQRLVNISATTTLLAAWLEAANLHEIDAVPFALVGKHRVEHAYSGIADVVGQVFVAYHTLHIQVLYTDRIHLVLVRQSIRYLVQVVHALMGYL